MPDASAEPARWEAARAAAGELADVGVDPLDVAAASTARTVLVRRFVLDALLIFGIVAIIGSVALLLFRGMQGDNALSGRELWIGTGSLVFVLIVVVLRAILPAKAGAYERAWNTYVERVWPGTPAGDDLGGARLAFVRRAESGGAGAFPATAPGRKASARR
ncbi:hypothetical protein BH11ACT3_BH11ACT3_14620 [soil metagenome]